MYILKITYIGSKQPNSCTLLYRFCNIYIIVYLESSHSKLIYDIEALIIALINLTGS